MHRVNALTIDVEDYHSIVSREWFGQDESPWNVVVKNTELILDILAEFDTKATFFMLGEVAETYKQMVRQIAKGGHELGVHGYKHLRVNNLTREQFRAEVEPAKKLIEDLTGQNMLGYRAAAFSVNLKMTWVFEVLSELGFKYDSSIYPIKSRRYGDSSARPEPFQVPLPGGTIWEIPPATLEFLSRRWPAGGGGYLRHFPYQLSRWALRKINNSRPATVYMHPYEIDTAPGREPDRQWPIKKRLRYRLFTYLQYRNRATVKAKLYKLLRDFKFARIVDVYDKLLA